MAKNVIEIIIKAVDEASKQIQGVSATLEKHRGTIMKVGAVSGAAFAALTFGIKDATKESMELNNALIGLSSIAAGVGVDVDKATDSAKSLASDGLMTVAEAATSLKNLLARGYGLEEAIDIMGRFKDSAAFGRQANLSFGESIVGATEGLKNENSVLVDNAGVTKNVSKMWEDYAKELGKSTKNLTDAEKRQAEYNGIMHETRFQVGDAAKLIETLSGGLSGFSAESKMAKAAVGDALEPILRKLIGTTTGVVSTFREWAEDNPKTVAGLVTFGAAASGGLMTLSAIGLAVPTIVKGYQLLNLNTKVLTASTWLYNAALNANPMGLLVGAIAILVASLVRLYQTNDTARYYMLQAWGGIKIGVMSAIDGILAALQKLTSFVPGVAEKIQQYRDSLSNMIDDEQITKSVRKAEKSMTHIGDLRMQEYAQNKNLNKEVAGSYDDLSNAVDANTKALGGSGKGSGNTGAIKENNEAMDYVEQKLLKLRLGFIAATEAVGQNAESQASLTAQHQYLNDSLFVVHQRVENLKDMIKEKSQDENVDAEVIKVLLEQYDKWIDKEKELQEGLKKTNDELKKQIDQKITLADLGGGKSRDQVNELASVIGLQAIYDQKGTITSDDLKKLPKHHTGKAAGNTSKEYPALIKDNEWVIPDENVKRIPNMGLAGAEGYTININYPQIRNNYDIDEIGRRLVQKLRASGVKL